MPLKTDAVALEREAARLDDCLAVSPKRAAKIMGCGMTRVYELINAREVDLFTDGRSRRITVSSIRARIKRLLAASAK